MTELNMYGYKDVNGNKKSPYKDLISNKGFSGRIFFFPEGLPGFEKHNEFTFVFNDKTNPFIFMNFCGDIPLSFVCIDPFCVLPTYKVKLSSDDKLMLNILDHRDVVYLTIAKIDKKLIEAGDLSEGSLVLKGPIAINTKNGYSKQIPLNSGEYANPYQFKNIPKFD